MRGFSRESLTKFRLLNFVTPLILQRLAFKSRRIVIVDMFAGPGYYESSELGNHYSSPVILHGAAGLVDAQVNLVLIEKKREVYQKLVGTTLQLPPSRNVAVVPVLGSCQFHTPAIVKMAEDAQVLLFSDPCGSEIPSVLKDVAKESNVTVMLRYSMMAARRALASEQLLAQLGGISMPYWGYNIGDLDGRHRYSFVVGTHHKGLIEACCGALTPALHAPAAFIRHSEKLPPLPTSSARSRNMSGKNNPRYVELSKGDLNKIVKMRKAGKSIKEIGEAISRSQRLVTQRLRWLEADGTISGDEGGNGKPEPSPKRSRLRLQLSEDVMTKLREMRAAGRSIREISEALKLTRSTAYARVKALEANGLVNPSSKPKGRNGGRSTRTITIPDKTMKAMAKMRKAGESWQAIGDKYGFSYHTAQRKLVKAGLVKESSYR